MKMVVLWPEMGVIMVHDEGTTRTAFGTSWRLR